MAVAKAAVSQDKGHAPGFPAVNSVAPRHHERWGPRTLELEQAPLNMHLILLP